MNDPAPATPRLLRAILVGGGIAATLDILYACARSAGHGRSPEWVLQFVASGLLGIAVYLVMNFVVPPLSAFPFHLSYPPMRLLEGVASHALFVGVPIALFVRWRAGLAREPARQRVD